MVMLDGEDEIFCLEDGEGYMLKVRIGEIFVSMKKKKINLNFCWWVFMNYL